MDAINLRKLVYKVREVLAKRICPDESNLGEAFARLRRDDPHNLLSETVISAEAAAIVNGDLRDLNEVAHDVTVKSKQSVVQLSSLSCSSSSSSSSSSSVWVELLRLAYADADAALPEPQAILSVEQYLKESHDHNCYS